MKRVLLLLFCSLMFSTYAQEEGTGYEYKKSFKERLYLGGNFAFSFSNTGSFINVSPYVGYRITDEFSVGPGVIYQYNSFRNRVTGFTSSYSIYGGSFFAQYMFMQYVILHANYQLITYPTALNEFGGSLKTRETESYLFLGGGVQYPLSEGIWVSVIVTYDVLDRPTKFQLYGRNPTYFVGFNVAL